MPIGSRGHIGIKKETTWGTRVAGDNDVFLPFVSEGLTRDIEEVVSAIQRGILDEPVSYQGQKGVAGSLVMEVHPVSIGHILRSALGAPTGGDLADSTETEFCDCEEAWISDASVIASLDAIDKKKGSYSVKIECPAGVTDGTILAYKDFTGIDMSAVTSLKFWIKTSIELTDAADLEILISETSGCGGTPLVKNVGVLAANTWTEVTVATGDLSGGDYDTVISVAIRLGADLAEFTTRIDDIRMVVAGTADVARKHIFTPMQTKAEEFGAGAKLTPLWPYTFEIYRDDSDNRAYEFKGCVVNTLQLNFSNTDKILKASLGIIAKDGGYVTKTAMALETTNPFLWENVKIGIGGTAAGAPNLDCESFTLNWDNKCVPKYTLNNTAIARRIIRSGYREIPITFTMDFIDQTEYDKFLAGTEQQFQIIFEGAVVGADAASTPYTLDINFPKVRYTAFPINIGGPGRLTVSVTAKAKYDAAGYAMLINLINDQEASVYAG